MSTMHEVIAHSASIIILIAYSIRFFNQPLYNYSETNERYKNVVSPVEPRLMTEYQSYKFFRLVFTGILIFIYAVVYIFLSSISAEGLKGYEEQLAKIVGEYSIVTSFVSLLVIIGVTQYPKWLSNLICDLREILHENARIPLKGHDLFDKLIHMRIDYSTDKAKSIIQTLMKNNPVSKKETRCDIELEDFEIENRKNILWKWAKLSYLLQCMSQELNKKRGHRLELEYNLGYRGLKHEYIELLDDIAEYRNHQDKWSREDQDKLREDVRKLLYQTCRMIACMLILNSNPRIDPVAWLKEHSYEVDVNNRKEIKSESIARVFGVLTLTIISFVFLSVFLYEVLAETKIEITAFKLFSYVMQSLIMMVLPLLYIVNMKKRLSIVGTWPSVLSIEEELPFRQRPWLIYAGLGFIAWLFTNVIASAFAYLAPKFKSGDGVASIGGFPDIMSIMWPFTFIAFVVVVMSAYRLDTVPFTSSFKIQFKPYARYLFQGLLQGLLIALVIKIGFVLGDIHTLRPETPPTSFFCLLGFMAGLSVSLAFQLKEDSYKEIDVEQELLGVEYPASI
ncbi:MAG: hypothetical protein OEY52_05740 [Gammaproteobacteria bacterium]|nr:hypothetical protein [Gammaproteobacteria bacterium]